MVRHNLRSRSFRPWPSENFYNRAIWNSVLIAEAIHTAQKITGKKVVNGEDVRRGFEALDITPARMKELGMEGFAALVGALDAIKEGDGTLLDHSLVLAYTDTSNAKLHAVDGIPMFLAGSASGRMKTGIHFAGASSTVARVGMTIQQAMGLSVDHWGTDSNMTNKPISEIMV